MRSHLTLLIPLFIGFILNGQVQTANSQTPQQIAKKAISSVVLLVIEDESGQPVSLGSGFLVGRGLIASNLHVLEGGYRGYAKLAGQKAKLDVQGVVGIDEKRDLALLKTSHLNTVYLPLGNSDSIEVGDPVYAVGNPQGLEGTFSQGIVSSVRPVGADKILQITSPISPGSSGGPVLSSRGEVIGVAVATFQGGQNLNFAIPSNYLKALLNDVQAVRPLPKTKLSRTSQSILGDLGGRSTEGVTGGQFTWGICCFGGYTFSLRNQLREPVRKVYSIVVFYDRNNSPLDFDVVRHDGLIPPGLAKRVSGRVDGSVQKLLYDQASASKVEFRVLDFQLAE